MVDKAHRQSRFAEKRVSTRRQKPCSDMLRRRWLEYGLEDGVEDGLGASNDDDN